MRRCRCLGTGQLQGCAGLAGPPGRRPRSDRTRHVQRLRTRSA